MQQLTFLRPLLFLHYKRHTVVVLNTARTDYGNPLLRFAREAFGKSKREREENVRLFDEENSHKESMRDTSYCSHIFH